MSSSYSFDIQQPPLLRDFPSILSVPSSALRSPFLGADSQPNSITASDDSQHDHWQWYYSYVIDRHQVWSITAAPHRYSKDEEGTRTVTSGYDETQMTTFQQTLQVTADASGMGFSASVMAELQLTEETTQSWHTQETDETQTSYKAGTTYCDWTLFEVLNVYAQKWYQYEYKGDPATGFAKQGDPTKTTVQIAIGYYDDSNADPAGLQVPSIRAFAARSQGLTDTGKLRYQ